MNKQLKKLKEMEGEKIIRIAPCGKYYSYCDEPVILRKVTVDGRLLIEHLPKVEKPAFRDELVLPKKFTDDKWINFKEIKKLERSSLSKYSGMYVKRKNPVELEFGLKEEMLTNGEKAKLLYATKFHVFINRKGKDEILDIRFANPEDWELA